jgi:hypothetical protein
MKFVGEAGKGAGAWTMFEMVNIAHALSGKLAQTEPRHRGPSG